MCRDPGTLKKKKEQKKKKKERKNVIHYGSNLALSVD